MFNYLFRLAVQSVIAVFIVGATISQFQLHADPHLRHWEKASRDPDRIVLNWSDDPTTSVAVTWRTNTDVKEAYAVIYPSIAEPSFELGAEPIMAQTQIIDQQIEPANRQHSVHYHTVVFEDLNPDTKYLYRVGDGVDHWSEAIEFKTASDTSAPFKFIYFGDAQNDVLFKWSRVMRAAYSEAPDASFILHAGDLINDGHYDQEWGEWFKAGGWIHSMVPSVVVTGNHEYRPFSNNKLGKKRLSMFWRAQFNLPTSEALPVELNETVYFHDFQGARIIVLNSNVLHESQAAWLEKCLEENPNAWSIVTFHHPMFSARENRDNKEMRDLWKPIMDKYSVDLVLQGHDHTYARGHIPVSGHEQSEGTGVRTMYVNSVSGPKMYEFMDTGWDVYAPEGVLLDRNAENGQFYQVIEIDGSRLIYQAFTANGLLYDAFQVTKDVKGNKTMSRLPVEVKEEMRFENTAPYKR